MEDDEVPTLIGGDEAPELVSAVNDANDNVQTSKPKPVPVTIITGFLGAGKTTLLDYILTAKHGNRIAVIQNEYGMETGAEKAMVIGDDGKENQEWLELPNGCICCNLRGDLVLAVENLLRKKRDKFDYVFIELDGLADPGPVASVFWVDDELESELYLDAIIAVVDAKNIVHHLNSSNDGANRNEAERQIAFADRIILNKMDLLDSNDVSALHSAIRKVNDLAPLINAERCRIPIETILNLGAFDLSKIEPLETKIEGHCSGCGDHDHHHHSHDSKHTHTAGVVTVGIVEEGDVSLEQWIYKWAWLDQEKGVNTTTEGDTILYRYKGIVSVEGSEYKYAIQGVRELFDIQPSPIKWALDEKRLNKIALIGKNLPIEKIVDSFNETVLKRT